jgi:hypothetical protein
MALLGSSVDPRLFIQDYSGFTRAAEIQAQGTQNLGAAIGQGIKDYGEIVGERKKTDAQIKADDVSIESAIKLGDSLGIDIKSYLEPIQALRKDPNTTPAQSLALGRAAAQGISNAFTLGIGAQEREIASQKAKAEAQYKQGMLGAAQTKAAASLFSARQKASEMELEEVPVVNAITGEKDSVLINKDAQGRMRDPESGKVIKDLFKYGNEMEGWEAPDQPEMSPTSQVGGNASDLIASAAEMNIGKLSTAKTPGTQGGNVGCADAICRTFKQATGEELVPGGTLSTREMATTLENDPRFVKVPLGQAQKGDIVLTPRKGNKAGHTGIVLDGGAIASNSSKGFAGKAPGTFVQNYTIDSWQRNVAPRNPRETAAYRYVGPQSIDNALAISGDMTQQAMGTSQQQAEAARQIELGQQLNLSTAQNISQGAIPTEPSMATQQPQLPQQAAPPVNRRLLSSRTQSKQQTMMTAEQVKNLEGQGFRVSAMPNPDGTFMVSGVTTGGSSKGIEVKTADGTIITYGGSGGLTQPKPEQGRQLIPDPTSPTGTRFVDIPGGEAEKAAKQEIVAAEAEKARGIKLGSVALAEIDNFINYTDEMSKLPLASPARKAFAAFGMQEQAEAESSLNTVRSNLKFEALKALREGSPSGASGLGQVTQNEFSALAEQWGDLRLVGDPEKIKERAIRIKKQLLDVIHGDQKHRDALLKSGAISQQQYNEIQSQYPGAKQVSQEDANIQRWRNTFTPQPTQ